MDQTLAVKPPDVSFARSGDVAIAYQLVGNGPMITDIEGSALYAWAQHEVGVR